MKRNPSIFQSTKSVVSKSVELTNSLFDIAIEEAQATTRLNKLENSVEYKQLRLSSIGDTAQLTAEALKQIEEIKAMGLPANIESKLLADLESAILN